jgi:hypothetical protein
VKQNLQKWKKYKLRRSKDKNKCLEKNLWQNETKNRATKYKVKKNEKENDLKYV